MPTAFSTIAAGQLAGPDWLSNRRVAAAEEFARAVRPSLLAEEWRYSRIGDFDLDEFTPAETLGDAPMARLDSEPAAMVRCVNGRIVSVDIDEALTEQGVRVGALANLPDGADFIGSVADHAGDYFTVLNDAFCVDPVLVDVPRGVVVDGPIVVTHHGVGDGTASFPRLIVRVGENAQASVMERHTSDNDAFNLVCPVVELDVAAAGRLGYLNVQELGDESWQLGSQLARVERDATVIAATAGFGGAYARSRADTRLIGRGAHGGLLSLYFGERDQTLDFRTYQDTWRRTRRRTCFIKGFSGVKPAVSTPVLFESDPMPVVPTRFRPTEILS